MNALPTGTVTFLFTDIEGSTKLWEEFPEAMKSALAKHDAILKETVESNHGQIVKTTGDGIHAVFTTAIDAINAAITAQHNLNSLILNYELP
ncbi:MAG TPA: adenylate/guanylate cyclase domain-containing protein, partial [Anaerolineales bacterium]|nr:adenylate/guanylate cyclase domain-containing protein [Anaerolineales bacterium]